jgi:phosphatidylglycerol lysyltransferase
MSLPKRTSRDSNRSWSCPATTAPDLRFQTLKINWPVWMVAGLTFLNGLFEVLHILIAPLHYEQGIFGTLPFGLHYWNWSMSLVFGLALLYLSLNLFRRKRVAWWLTVISSAMVALVHAVSVRPWYAVVAPAAILGLLLLFRSRFMVHSEPTSILRGLEITVASIVLLLAYGTAGFWLLDVRDFGIDFRLSDAFVRTRSVYTFIGNHHLIPRTHHATWFLDSLRLAGLVTGGFAAYSLFRPLAYRLQTLPHERQEAKVILERDGTSSLDFFKLWPDKSHFFSEDWEFLLAYKQSANVVIALGDPVGPEQEELEAITRDFVRHCSDNGWGVAFYEAVSELLPMYRRLGMKALKIGEEAIIDLEYFRSRTVGRKKFRWAKRKFEREGYFLSQHSPPHPQSLLDEAEEISEEWLSFPGRRERGFTLGSFDRAYLGETRIFVLRDSKKRPLAFANQVPSYKEGEATIDLKRYRLEVPNGTMDYLLIELMLALTEEGYRRFDLGLAPLAGVGDRPETSLEERALSQMYEYLNRFFSYKGLRNYKAKFEPGWEERFLVYKGGLPGLAKVGLALRRVTEE